jgi:DNA-binding MarR family transcriptional regulator
MSLHPETAEHFIDELFRLGRSMRGALADNDAPELLPGSAAILLTLAMLGEVRQNALADEMFITQSALSRQVGELVSRGYIDRSTDPDDGRASLVRVSEAGQELLRSMRLRRAERLQHALADWTEPDAAAAFDMVAKLSKTLSKHAHSHHAQRRFGLLVADSTESKF